MGLSEHPLRAALEQPRLRSGKRRAQWPGLTISAFLRCPKLTGPQSRAQKLLMASFLNDSLRDGWSGRGPLIKRQAPIGFDGLDRPAIGVTPRIMRVGLT